MKLKVGDEFRWNNRGSFLKVTKITIKKIQFEVHGAILMTGSMCVDEFKQRYVMKDERLAA